jgi:hypothetical protein
VTASVVVCSPGIDSPADATAARRLKQAQYDASPAGRARRARYNTSDKGRKRNAAYRASDIGRETRARFWDSANGITLRFKDGIRANASMRGAS